MENLDMVPHYPDEDDAVLFRGQSTTTGAWWMSLVSLAFMLVAGAAVLA